MDASCTEQRSVQNGNTKQLSTASVDVFHIQNNAFFGHSVQSCTMQSCTNSNSNQFVVSLCRLSASSSHLLRGDALPAHCRHCQTTSFLVATHQSKCSRRRTSFDEGRSAAVATDSLRWQRHWQRQHWQQQLDWVCCSETSYSSWQRCLSSFSSLISFSLVSLQVINMCP